MKHAFKTIGLATLGGAITLGVYLGFVEEPKQVFINGNLPSAPVVQAKNSAVLEAADFATAAEMSVNSVVHVNVAVERQRSPWEEFFYGGGKNSKPQIVQGSGSGVIISPDGYIVTNNHVIDGAQSIKVALNDNRNYKAELIGSDPTTDLALLKIEAEDLSPLSFGNSDELRLGEWVLAVGNPFNLTSTVTAGIISAKGRNINIINDRSAIEAFIQTDAAVNPGNSGGALVNARGQLIGINTAISTHTGSFEGYSFAVPVNIVQKVIDDLRLYGTVQRAFLGVSIANVSQELAKEQDLRTNSGVFVVEAIEDGAADEAGIERGDVIIGVDGKEVTKMAELLEQIGRKRPGDKADVMVYRGEKKKSFSVTLKNQQGTTQLITKDELETDRLLGADFKSLSGNEKQKYGLRYGVKVNDAGNGKLKRAGVPQGFIIVKVNNKLVENPEDIESIIGALGQGDGVLIQGYHPNGRADYFAFGL